MKQPKRHPSPSLNASLTSRSPRQNLVCPHLPRISREAQPCLKAANLVQQPPTTTTLLHLPTRTLKQSLKSQLSRPPRDLARLADLSSRTMTTRQRMTNQLKSRKVNLAPRNPPRTKLLPLRRRLGIAPFSRQQNGASLKRRTRRKNPRARTRSFKISKMSSFI